MKHVAMFGIDKMLDKIKDRYMIMNYEFDGVLLDEACTVGVIHQPLWSAFKTNVGIRWQSRLVAISTWLKSQ